MGYISTLSKTFKSTDTEEFLDIYFYRPFGYVMALAARKMNITPSAVTIFSIFVGVAAGHMFFYRDLTLNIIGILLLIWAEALDSTDGQLARITNTKSRIGRILDGFGGNLWFLSIYIHLCFRVVLFLDYSPYVFLLAIVSGFSHSIQSAYADYYRNQYLFFIFGEDKSEIDTSEELQDEYSRMKWSEKPFKKFLMRVYLNYTVEQELLNKNTLKLYRYARNNPGKITSGFSNLYKKMVKPNIKYFNILTTNTRMIVLFIAILSEHFLTYFYFELTVLNLLWVYTVYKQEKISKTLLNSITGSE